MKILVINGPNLNLLGIREKNVYGAKTLDDVCNEIKEAFQHKKDVYIDFYQSNIEGEIVSKIGDSREKYDGIVINPGAYSHYSIAILDAIRGVDVPTVEVHISNIYKREEYRRKSVTAEGCVGVLSGFSYYGYIMAIDFILNYISG